MWDKMVKTLAAAAGAVMGWWTGLGVMPQVLAVVMVIDYITGLMCAWKGVSPKTESGHVSSKAGFDGLIKKAAIILVVLLALQIDTAIGTNEGVSILENTALLGVPYPAALMNALETMKQKGEDKKDEEKKE